ncbi:flagellar motor stator protein MotA [Desulfovibrio sulfodismutans]|uniref:Flagellar motor stator protein MotA n=1 Tax=Desulfolutivibrio sulfodismutans TaxID=63561 RepID=A0A7K3NIU1_9BACT|nr:flagellar motor stator protein MotA [Desulfolutivibrio sulfodismutans]NDY55705.1 flagellar motor stator protein MotA [Desulfolutivibrio sulfodismutans]QLA13726.1 flagellar motor stator protein MotA [Desulfolutivibrio sulfodismutans DSM 3696]
MFVIIGIVIVLGAVGLGFFFEKGNFSLLFSAAPAEMLIIFGGALGSLVISSPKDILGHVFKSLFAIFGSMKTSKGYYLEMLTVLSMLFMKIRREGLVAIEKDIEHPTESPIFSSFAKNKNNAAVVSFVCDTMRIFSTVNIEQHEFDNIMDADIETSAHEALVAAHTMNKTADALPGLGIVAAVLGVVITMGKLNEPPEVLGHSIGAALVGTMLGVLGCYGFLGPMAANMEHRAKEVEAMLLVVKAALGAFVGGNPPPVALEAGRRAIPTGHRPTFEELEEAIKASKGK